MKRNVILVSMLVLGAGGAGTAMAACDVTVHSQALSNNQLILKSICSGGAITGINWLRDGQSIGADALSPAVPDGKPVYRTTPVVSGTHQYTATGAMGASQPTVADIAAGEAAVITTAQPVLTVAVTPGGSVTSAPSGITGCTSAGGTCSSGFDTGTSVSLTATATQGYAFSGWSGDCTGSAPICAVGMLGPKSVSANFGPEPTNGACGSANSSTPVANAPSSGLCGAGTPSSVTDPVANPGSYTWTCAGLNGGATSGQCSVPKIVNGACGTANGSTGVTSAPSGIPGACNPGVVQNMTAGASTYTWTCGGYNGGTTSASCSATMAPTNGVCGSANGGNTAAAPTGAAACTTGNITGMTSPVSPGGSYTWTCSGLAGGQASGQCSAAQTVNGACGSANGVSVSSAPTTNLCAAGSTATAVSGSGPWTWGCNGVNGGTSTSATACSAPVASGNCGATPSNYLVVHPGDVAYSGTWRPDTSGATYVAQLPVGSGVALEFTVNKSVYPYGFKVTDSTGGTKTYTLSKCPGSNIPVDDQNGTTSVNGDAKLDNCKVVNGFVRWKETSGASASYYNGSSLSFQTTCFLPTTTQQGSATPATYYLNILNTGTSAVGIQYSNNPQGS